MTARESRPTTEAAPESTARTTTDMVADDLAFYAALDSLVVTVDLDGRMVVGPIADELTGKVARFVTELVASDAELAATVAERVRAALAAELPLAVPVASFVDALAGAAKRGGLA